MDGGVNRLGAGEVECDVITRREGVLSPVGHDLRFRAGRAEWALDPAGCTVEAAIDARSLAVAAALHGDRDAPGALSASDRQKIERTLHDEVLHTARHPSVTVRARYRREGDRGTVEGEVTLRGAARPFTAEARREGDRWVAVCTLDQTAFGIRPFTAMMGALKVRREVTVRVSLPARALDAPPPATD